MSLGEDNRVLDASSLEASMKVARGLTNHVSGEERGV